MSDEEELAELTKHADKLGFRVIHDHTWGYILWRPGSQINPGTDSNADLNELREMIAGIEWGREHGTVKKDWQGD
jgi:hypothetical protein